MPGAEGGAALAPSPRQLLQRHRSVRGDDATLQEWQGWLASVPGAPASRQAGTGLIQPCPAPGSPGPRGGPRTSPAVRPGMVLLWVFPLPAADRELLP